MSLAADAEPFRSVKSRVTDFLHWLPKGTRLPEASWTARHRLLIAISWLQVPFLAIVGWNTSVKRSHGAAEIGLVILLLLLQGLSTRRVTKAVIVSLALVTCSALLVHFTAGLIESHFHFFVVLPLISLYRDWRRGSCLCACAPHDRRRAKPGVRLQPRGRHRTTSSMVIDPCCLRPDAHGGHPGLLAFLGESRRGSGPRGGTPPPRRGSTAPAGNWTSGGARAVEGRVRRLRQPRASNTALSGPRVRPDPAR